MKEGRERGREEGGETGDGWEKRREEPWGKECGTMMECGKTNHIVAYIPFHQR